MLGVDTPLFAFGPRLPFPDRHRGLQRIDTEPGARKSLGPVRGGSDDDNGRLADLQRTGAMHQNEAFQIGPTDPSIVGQRRKAGLDLTLVGLVLKLRHILATVGMITGHAAEKNDATTIGRMGPFECHPDRERIRRQRNPRVARRRWDHGAGRIRFHPFSLEMKIARDPNSAHKAMTAADVERFEAEGRDN